MTQSNNSSSGMWFIILALAVLAAVMNMIGGTNSTVAPSVNRNTFEHRYATERLKQEGYSTSESQQAADAIIKFHEAQKNRYK